MALVLVLLVQLEFLAELFVGNLVQHLEQFYDLGVLVVLDILDGGTVRVPLEASCPCFVVRS